MSGTDPRVAALLAQAGGPALLRAQTRGREGDAALHLAARLGLADMARMLVECGAEVGARGKFGGARASPGSAARLTSGGQSCGRLELPNVIAPEQGAFPAGIWNIETTSSGRCSH